MEPNGTPSPAASTSNTPRRSAERPIPAPFWLPNGCPTWCDATEEHSGADHLDDRVHWAPAVNVPVSLHKGQDHGAEGFKPETVEMHLRQNYREVEPIIEIGFGDQRSFLRVTLDEAHMLAEALTTFFQLGRKG